MIWISAILGYNFVAYPGEMIKPFKVTKEYFLKEDVVNKVEGSFIYNEGPAFLANWLEISFQRQHETDKSEKNSVPASKIDEPCSHTEIIKGLTAGVLSMPMDDNVKVKLLVDALIAYRAKAR